MVDDERQIRLVLKTALSSRGYAVRTAEDGDEALHTFQAWAPGLVITDLRMPNMGGLELAREAQAMRPGIRVLMMSGYTETAVSGQGLITPGTVFIHKPFTAASLRAKVVEALG